MSVLGRVFQAERASLQRVKWIWHRAVRRPEEEEGSR